MPQIGNQAKSLNAVELLCKTCGKKYIYRRYQQEERVLHNRKLPRYCFACYHAYLDEQKQRKEACGNREREQKRAKEKAAFEQKLCDWNCVKVDEIVPKSSKVLYIIGNGFDLMHGVQSSYYSFRQTLGKNSPLMHALENYLTPDDIWADFENALAHFNVSMMANSTIVDMWLDIYDAYQEDSSMADYYAATEAAADPMTTIAYELPKRFRTWVEGLSVRTKERPLKHMFSEGKVLCFNYTEFVEKLYGISEKNVCYIHGCRRKKKGHPKEKLILGHRPGDSEASFENFRDDDRREKNSYKRALQEAAQENIMQIISECDEELTKNSAEIIKVHKDFFQSLHNMREIIVIGHSYSQVDWDYFREITLSVTDANAVKWYFGCYGWNDLNNLEKMLTDLGISQSCVRVFRTDMIQPVIETDTVIMKKPEEKLRCVSDDDKWFVATERNRMFICNKEDHSVHYEVQFSSYINKAFFTEDSRYLILYFKGIETGICIFKLTAGTWEFVGELESILNQSLINPRLKHVFIEASKITFVYNNRVREYSLESGQLLKNQQRKYKKETAYPGTDVREQFCYTKR